MGGSEGAVWTTSDGGRTWRDVSPPGSKGLLFRDVEATDRRTVSVLAIGEGTASRIYQTHDAGRTWTRTFTNHDARAFYDCMTFWPGGRRGLAVSDPVGGRFRILRTTDGGASWSVDHRGGMPRAVDGEFAFAASGTCLVTGGWRDAYLASGGSVARVFHTANRGRTWRNRGDLSGYRSGVDLVEGPRGTAVAVGPSGSDATTDRGRTWQPFSTDAFDAVQCTDDGACWASGPEGAVARLVR